MEILRVNFLKRGKHLSRKVEDIAMEDILKVCEDLFPSPKGLTFFIFDLPLVDTGGYFGEIWLKYFSCGRLRRWYRSFLAIPNRMGKFYLEDQHVPLLLGWIIFLGANIKPTAFVKYQILFGFATTHFGLSRNGQDLLARYGYLPSSKSIRRAENKLIVSTSERARSKKKKRLN